VQVAGPGAAPDPYIPPEPGSEDVTDEDRERDSERYGEWGKESLPSEARARQAELRARRDALRRKILVSDVVETTYRVAARVAEVLGFEEHAGELKNRASEQHEAGQQLRAEKFLVERRLSIRMGTTR
jgi:hypothetical protein